MQIQAKIAVVDTNPYSYIEFEEKAMVHLLSEVIIC